MGLPKYDMATAAKMIHAFVPISRFNTGEAGKIIEDVKNDGICLIVKNNAPECVLLSLDEYDRLIRLSENSIKIIQTKEEEAKRKAFIQRIRQNVPPPLPPTITDRKALMDSIGSIDVDEEAVYELRRISTL